MQVKKQADRPWTNAELRILYEDRLLKIPHTTIARKLGRTHDSVRKKYSNTDWGAMKFFDPTKEKLQQSTVDAELKKMDLSIQNSLDKFKLRADVIADRMAKAIDRLPPAKLENWKPRNKAKKDHHPEDIGLLLSDIHIGHEHTLEETGNLSEYSVDIFRKRLENLQYAVADIYDLHSSLYDLPTLHIMCLGDIVDGMNDVGAWSPVYISTPIFDQIAIAVQSLSECIYYWLTIFPEIHFYGIRGNHGRVAKTGSEKDYNNWDNIIYMILQIRFENNPRIHFHLPKTWWMMKEIRNHKFLMVHGDDVKGKDTPIRSFIEFEKRMTGLIGAIPEYTVAGHFHNAAEITTHSGKLILNGSFVGADVYSLRNAMAGNTPEQKLFGIHDQHGITWTYNINLNHMRKKRIIF